MEVVLSRGFRLSELRAEGLSGREIGRGLGLGLGIVSNHLRWVGGIRPKARRRPERCLSLEEREEVSRGVARGASARAIAGALGRSHTTIAREINRCSGRRRYRAHAADREAWRRSRRPRPTKLELCPELCRLRKTTLSARRFRTRWNDEKQAGRCRHRLSPHRLATLSRSAPARRARPAILVRVRLGLLALELQAVL
jgi:DNA-binding CsgD family transcriptional regulator